MTQIAISTEFIKLDAFLKFASAVCSGGEAKIIIAEGICFLSTLIRKAFNQ